MRKSWKSLVVAVGAGALLAFGTGAVSAQDLPGMSTANDATGGGMEAAAVGTMGNTEFDESTAQPLLDLPALNVDQDANGRIKMDLPGLTLVGNGKAPARPGEPGLPKTGVNVGDFLALGLAGLAGGSVFLRRLRVATV